LTGVGTTGPDPSKTDKTTKSNKDLIKKRISNLRQLELTEAVTPQATSGRGKGSQQPVPSRDSEEKISELPLQMNERQHLAELKDSSNTSHCFKNQYLN